jgi:AcrR family transcriptional regulator
LLRVVDALGASDTTLAHHFGTKDQMLAAILGRLRERMLALTSKMAGERLRPGGGSRG